MGRLSAGWCMFITGAALLTGCTTGSKALYQWENYQPQLYEYFTGGSPEAQVAELERGLAEIRARNAMPPPGYHAHLGMLYANLGKDDQMIQEFQTEKALFPEAAPYIDFLLNNVRTETSSEFEGGNN